MGDAYQMSIDRLSELQDLIDKFNAAKPADQKAAMEEIVRICDKHNIPYFVIGGTAIGALYDKAILPWDDDIDIGMKREDSNKFLQIADVYKRQ